MFLHNGGRCEKGQASPLRQVWVAQNLQIAVFGTGAGLLLRFLCFVCFGLFLFERDGEGLWDFPRRKFFLLAVPSPRSLGVCLNEHLSPREQ